MIKTAPITTIAMAPCHWPEVVEIYRQGLLTGQATYEQDTPEWQNWDKGHLKKCRILAIQQHKILGWAALSPVSGRCVYAGVAEVSVYVGTASRGKGVGKLLLQKLIKESEQEGIWTLQAGIFSENEASVHLHKSFGFRIVGHREKLGKMNGVWRDVLFLERRSTLVGIE